MPRARLLLRPLGAVLLALVALSGCDTAELPDEVEPADLADVAEQPRPELPDDAPDWLVELAHHDPLAEPQALSLFGEPLMARVDEEGRIAAADEALAADPSNPDLLIEAGRERRHAWQYAPAVELYTRAIEVAPDDWRAWRFRGHRHLSLRDFDQAVADLEEARSLAPMNWDVAYHLALAHFVAGDLEAAADEYLRCLALSGDAEARAAGEDGGYRSCADNDTDEESFVAMAEWTVRALMRTGRDAEVEALLADIPDDLAIETNVAYWENLRLHKGLVEEEALLDPADDAGYRLETVGFGVANRWIAQGDTARAVELLERLMEDEWWPGFGRIAAEAELHRLRGSEGEESGLP